MKLFAVVAIAVTALALSGTARAATSPTNFRVAEAVPVDDIIGGQGELFDGLTTGAFPTIGRATMEVESFFEYNVDSSFNYGSGFAVTFTTSNGDRLTLASPFVLNTFFLSSGTWSVHDATGRFATYSGSGTFTATLTGTPSIDLTETVTLSGFLKP
jgi:hypothetical protein